MKRIITTVAIVLMISYCGNSQENSKTKAKQKDKTKTLTKFKKKFGQLFE